MRLGYSILYVRSVPDTIAFYEAAFGVKRGMVLESGDSASWRRDRPGWPSPTRASPPG